MLRWLLLHCDIGNHDGIALHVPCELNRMARMNLQERRILVGDFVHLPVADENKFAAALHASKRAIAIGQSGMGGSHLRVTGATVAVANLTHPGPIGGSGKRSEPSQQAQTTQAFQDFLHGGTPFELPTGGSRFHFTLIALFAEPRWYSAGPYDRTDGEEYQS